MQFYDNVVELIGNTPLVRLSSVTAHLGPDAPLVLAKVEYLNPGGSVKDRIATRMIEAAEASGALRARRHDRGADERQHRGRPGPRGAATRLPLRVRLPRQGERRQAERAARVRRRGRGLPHRGRPRGPAVLLLGLRPARARDRRRVEAGPVLEPEQPALALRDHRSRALGADRRPHHALRRGRRHRRHDQRDRALPQGGQRRSRAGHRRRPGRLGLLRRHGTALPRRGGRRGLLAGLRTTATCATRSSRCPTATRSS